jgi:uncharacterized protein
MSHTAIQAYMYGYLHKEAQARKLTALAGNGYKVAGVVRGALTGDTKRFSLENVEELPGDPWIAVSRSRKALSAAELRAFHKAYNADPDGKGVPYYYMVETPDGEELVAFQGDDRLYTTGEATKVGAALGIPKEQLDFKGSDMEPLSRYTDDEGTGAYEAAMAQAPDEGRLLETLRAAWNLPNPGNLKKHPQARSYFTEVGDAEFDKHHRHILETALAKALKKQQIGSGELNAVYRDKYQVIGEPIPKEALDLSKYDQMYHTFDSGHGPDHQQKTMAAARALAEAHAPNKLHLAELAARLHDVGLSVNREAHESEGARIVAEDEQFLKELTPRERAILINAIRQHRASTGKPRSIVGKIVSDADRVSSASTDGALARAIGFGKANHPELTKEENERRAYLYLASKYKPGGTGWRFYFPETGEKLNEIYAPIVQRAAELQRDVQ